MNADEKTVAEEAGANVSPKRWYHSSESEEEWLPPVNSNTWQKDVGCCVETVGTGMGTRLYGNRITSFSIHNSRPGPTTSAALIQPGLSLRTVLSVRLIMLACGLTHGPFSTW